MSQEINPEKPCRHEYVRIYQRKLKGLERRLVSTKAWLPVGFKVGDFTHLGEGSYCFCATCRARLYPRRSQAEKAQARVAFAQGRANAAAAALAGISGREGADQLDMTDSEARRKALAYVGKLAPSRKGDNSLDSDDADDADDLDDRDDSDEADALADGSESQEGTISADIHVEELELEQVDVQDIEAEGVKLADDEETCNLSGDEDL